MNISINKLINWSRIALGIIFIWYGMLKFFPELSPAEDLATMTISKLSFGCLPAYISIKLLATWELLIGIGFLFAIYIRYTCFLFLVHMLLTFTPLLLFPDISFSQAPFAFTLVGQYIVKNIVFILVGFMIYKNHSLEEMQQNKIINNEE